MTGTGLLLYVPAVCVTLVALSRVDRAGRPVLRGLPAFGRFGSLTIASVEWKGYVGCARAFMTRVLFVREHGRWVWHLVIGDRWG